MVAALVSSRIGVGCSFLPEAPSFDFDSLVEVPVSVVVAFEGVVVEPLPEPLGSPEEPLGSPLALGVGVGAATFGGLVVEDGGNNRLGLLEELWGVVVPPVPGVVPVGAGVGVAGTAVVGVVAGTSATVAERGALCSLMAAATATAAPMARIAAVSASTVSGRRLGRSPRLPGSQAPQCRHHCWSSCRGESQYAQTCPCA